MNRIIILIAAFSHLCAPGFAFSSSLHAVSAYSRKQARPCLMSMTSPRLHKMSPLAFAKRSSTHLSFSQAGSKQGNDEHWIRPAVHNSPLFRVLAIIYALLFAIYQGSSAPAANSGATAFQKIGKHIILAPKVAATLHVLSFGTWFGTVVYTTFIAGITMFKNLDRRVFGRLQSKLFPLYFQLCTGMIGIQVLTLLAMPDILSKTSELSLVIAFFCTLFNLLYLEPASTANMFDRYKMEDEGKTEGDEYKKLKASFGKFHGMSSLFNLVALIGGIVHGSHLASSLIV